MIPAPVDAVRWLAGSLRGVGSVRRLRLAVLACEVASLCDCAKLPAGQLVTDAVSIRGTHELDGSDVENKVATQPSPKFFGLFRGVVYDYVFFNRSTLQRDLARVERFYRERGYYSAHARAGRVITVAPGHVRVEILVEEGKPTLNAGLSVEGTDLLAAPIARAVQAAARSALPEGKPFDQEQAKQCDQDVRAVLTDASYAHAVVKRDTYVDVVHRRAETHLTITAGESARFGRITIVGLDPDGAGPRLQEVPEAPVRRAVNIIEGGLYSTSRIEAATRALLDLQVFASVSVVPDLSHPESPVVPLEVRVEASNLHQVRLGGGIEFDELKSELHVIAGWEAKNFLGDLRDLSIEFTPGLVLYPTRIDNLVAPDHFFPEEKLRAELVQPGFIEAETRGFVRPEFNVFPLLVQTSPLPDDPVVGYREFKGSIGVDRNFGKRFYLNLSYDMQVENPFSYKGTLDTALATLVIAYPELLARLDYRDNVDHPHSGFYLANDLQVAGGVFGGDVSDVRVQPEVRTYLPIAHKVTLASRGSVGFLFQSNYGDVVRNHLSDPATEGPDGNRASRVRDIETVLFRGFFSGGATSNRGFPLRGIAPHGVVPFLNPATASQQVALKCAPPPPPLPGQQQPQQPPPDPKVCAIPIGGFSLWELSSELRFAVQGPLSGATFCDAGDVSAGTLQLRFDHLHLSCGVGLRYDTPVGPIRLDVGYRIQPLQVLGFANEVDVYNKDPTNGLPPTFLGGSALGSGIPLAIAIGIGEAY